MKKLRSIYYGTKSDCNPSLIREVEDSKYEDVETNQLAELTEKDITDKQYVKITPYMYAYIIEVPQKDLLNSLYLVLRPHTTEYMVNDYQYAIGVNLVKLLLSNIPECDCVDSYDYFPTNEEYDPFTKSNVLHAINLYRDDYIGVILDLIDKYGFENIRNRLKRYSDIENKSFFVKEDALYRKHLIEILKNIFSLNFKIYNLADTYINQLIAMQSNPNGNLLTDDQVTALYELSKVLNPFASYNVEANIHDIRIIPESVVLIPYKYTIPIDELKKNNKSFSIVILRKKVSWKTYVLMYKERTAFDEINNTQNVFTQEEVARIKNMAAI